MQNVAGRRLGFGRLATTALSRTRSAVASSFSTDAGIEIYGHPLSPRHPAGRSPPLLRLAKPNADSFLTG